MKLFKIVIVLTALALTPFQQGCQDRKPRTVIADPFYRNVQATVNACEKYSFPIDWGLAMVFTESSFNENCVSDKGAVGVGQVMPATARCIDSRIKRSQLFNADINMDVSIRHLTNLLEKNCGNMESALREYNGGNKWRKKDSTRRYYELVKKNRARLLKQEAYNEKDFLFNYYYVICMELVGSDNGMEGRRGIRKL